jgi:branched-chain amino acid transport system permease protein
VSSATQFYLTTILVYLGVNLIAVWGLDVQFGRTGIASLAYIAFQATGAYTAAILTLGPASRYRGLQTYVGGATLPFPLPILVAGVVGGAVAVPIGLISLNRLRTDYQALTMLVISLIATGVATAQTSLVNGPIGLALIPAPLANVTSSTGLGYQWLFVGIVAAVCIIVLGLLLAITSSPFGRAMRAVRESATAAAAVGCHVTRIRLTAFVLGGALAAVSGALLVEYIGAWSPESWTYPETFLFFTALIVGGAGNLLGAAIGALLVPVLFFEATRFLPTIGAPGLSESLQWIAIGLMMMAFLWFRPRGLVPERRRSFGRRRRPPLIPIRGLGLRGGFGDADVRASGE